MKEAEHATEEAEEETEEVEESEDDSIDGSSEIVIEPKRGRVVESDPPKEIHREHWWQREDIPTFMQVWKALQQLGFRFTGNRYLAPGRDKISFDTPAEIRRYLCANGIADTDRLAEEDWTRLSRWISFAFVPVTEGFSLSKLEDVEILSNDDVRAILSELGFEIVEGSKYYPPRAKAIDGYHRSPSHKTHYYKGIEEIRGYVRATEDLCIDSSNGLSRRRRNKALPVDDSRMLALRLWAALSTEPLQSYRTNSQPLRTEEDNLEESCNEPSKQVARSKTSRNSEVQDLTMININRSRRVTMEPDERTQDSIESDGVSEDVKEPMKTADPFEFPGNSYLTQPELV